MDLQCCVRGDWLFQGSSLYIPIEGRVRAHAILPTPLAIARIYDQVFKTTGLACRPALIWVETLHGYGGLYLGDAIALGRADLNAIANRIWRKHFQPLTRRQEMDARLWNPDVRIYQFGEMVLAVFRFVIAHEFGHVRQGQCGVTGTALELEADADRFEGIVSAALGWDSYLQSLVAHELGCTAHAFCTHPAPQQRVELHRHGEFSYQQYVA